MVRYFRAGLALGLGVAAFNSFFALSLWIARSLRARFLLIREKSANLNLLRHTRRESQWRPTALHWKRGFAI